MKKLGCILFVFFAMSASAQIQVSALRTELLVNPIGIANTNPRFSWELNSKERNVQQVAYEILVASSIEKLNANQADIWNSGKVNANQSIQIVFAGKKLISREQCYWKLKSYTNKGASNWSAMAQFSMGLLQSTDWTAKWIGYDKAAAWDSVTQFSRLSARYFRKQFQSNKAIKKAQIFVAGLGLYELFINGQKVGNQLLAPAPTDYRKTVLYNSFDVANYLHTGNNVVAMALGNGRYFTMRQNYKPQKINAFGFPKLLLQLEIEYTDGTKKTIESDASWRLNIDGPIRTANEYDGEEYDARKELTGWNNTNYTDDKWLQATLVNAPEGSLVAQSNEPIRIMKKIQPVSINKIGANRFVLDMGQNFSGWIQMKVKGLAGNQVTLRFAESLQKNGEIYVANLRDAKATDKYTLKGAGIEVWHPCFVYHGFRFVEISNYPGTPTVENFEGQLVFDDLPTIGKIETSNTTINAIVKNAWWGIASNYKGMPVDCPQRNERQPWLGDRATGAYGESFLFGNQNLYAKWLDDIEDAQTKEGAIPDVAPAFWNYYSDNITWPGTYILVANMLHKQFADQHSIIKHYPSMKKWMLYMQGKYLKDYILTKDKYGDWCVPPESLELIHSKDSSRTTNGALIATAYYYQLLQLMQSFAIVSNQQSDTIVYKELSEKIKQAFNQRFYNKQKKYYDNNSITANLLPLYFGITPESEKDLVFNNIYNKIKIENHMHISTGVIGTQWLMRTLTNFQRSDIAYTLASNKTYPSWGYMAENGATTIWELWNGNTANPQMNSQNHVMLLGDLLIWLFENVAGIKSSETELAFKKIIMKPEDIDGLHFTNSSYRSLYGNIVSNWKKSNAQFNWQISIPANTSATIYIPAPTEKAVFEDGQLAMSKQGIQFIKMDGQNAVFEIGSGNYSFLSKFEQKKGILVNEFIFNRSDFPESHAATITQTPKGLYAAWFGGTKEGNKDVCIWASEKINNQWSAPKKIADGIMNDSVRYACYNPVLYQVVNGDLLLFYKIGPNVAGWTGWMMRSTDNGHTWSKREALPDGFLGPIKNKPIFINGQLVCPSSTEKTGWKVHFEYTADWGKTWTKSIDINDGKTITAIQPSILQYANGAMQVLCRSRNTTLNQSWSMDKGKTWSAMTATNLPNNNSGTDAVTLKDGTQVLVYNHVKPAANLPNGKGARTPLNVAISKDGIKWFAVAVLEDATVGQYSYPSVIQSADGLVHIVYTWRRERIKHVVMDMSTIEQREIVNGIWPSEKKIMSLKASDD